METVLLYILGILIMVIGLAVSIGLHEIGHLVPAKLFGVKVTQYMVGFGKTLWSRRRGETEYGVKAIPLGGYIAMIGMFPPGRRGEAARESSTGFLQALGEERPDALRPRGARRERVFDGLVQDAREASAETIGDGEDPRAFYRQPVWKRIIIMLGGPAMNLLLAFVFFGILAMGFGTPTVTTTVASVSECVFPASAAQDTCTAESTPAPGAVAGLQPGDRLVSLGGVPIETWEEGTELIRQSPGRTQTLVVERAGESIPLQLTPLLTERNVLDERGRVVTDAQGAAVTEQVGFIGMTAATENVRAPLTAVPGILGENVAATTHMILNLPERIVGIAQAAFGSGERDPNGPMSVVGVGRLAGELVSTDTMGVEAKMGTLVGLLGSLNVALFAFNLIPLMPLDGGHVLTALYEGARRGLARLFRRPDPGPVDGAKLMPLTFVVVIILGGLTALLVFADLVNPINIFR